MRFSESEIVEDVLEHIRQAGGEFGEWHVGTASQGGMQWAAGSGQEEPRHQPARGQPLFGHWVTETFAMPAWMFIWVLNQPSGAGGGGGGPGPANNTSQIGPAPRPAAPWCNRSSLQT